MEYELYHHGILGQKWGIRRFQNADGSLTAAGRKRLGVKEGPYESNKEHQNSLLKRSGAKIDGYSEQKMPGKVTNYRSMNKIAKEGKIITDETGKIIDKFGTKTKKTTDVDPSTLSDEELRQIINRLNMEEQYTRLTTKNETSKGAQAVKDILSFAGSALVVAGSVTAIMANIKQLENK